MTGTILITGANGQVGHELNIAECPYQLCATDVNQLDITDIKQIEAVFGAVSPGIVINAAAYTLVDKAEHESELAFAINRDGVANLAIACRKLGIPLLHISTDYVFDGEKRGAYVESDPVAPLGVYGESKAEGEAVLRATLDEHLILRTSWVFSATGNNFVKTMLRLGKERDELNIVDDQLGCPTSAASIALVLLNLASRYLGGEHVEWGTYHYCDLPQTTWFGFASEVFDLIEGTDDLKLNPISTSEYPTLARRPQNSVLDCQKINSSFNIKSGSWREELANIIFTSHD